MNQITGGSRFLNIPLIIKMSGAGDRMRVADLGCGAGYIVFPLSGAIGKKGLVYAVDILKNVLDNINRKSRQENIENIKTVWSDLEIFGATKIEAGSIDVAFLINTLYQSNKKNEILREAVRMLKKDGRLVIVEWKNVSIPFGPTPDSRITPETLKGVCSKLGLRVDEEFEASDYHFGLVMVKI